MASKRKANPFKFNVAYIVLPLFLIVFLALDCDIFLRFVAYNEANSFKDKVIWITGASSGIGASLAEDLVKSGAHVIISARRQSLLEEVARKCSSLGHSPMILPLDVLDHSSQKLSFEKIIAKYGHVDSLVLNAGRSQRSLAVDTPFSATEEIMNLNFFSYVSLTKIVLPSMIANGGGQIVVMSSVSGRLGTPIASSYSASKFALHGYFEALRSEVAPHNISISMVLPGPVESEIAQHAVRSPDDPSQDEGKKMSTARCTHLIAKGMYHKLSEMWISEHPPLLGLYINTYAPWLGRELMIRLFGPARIKALKQGTDLFNFKAAVGITAK